MAGGFTLRVRPEATREIGAATDEVVIKLGREVEANARRIVPVGVSRGKHRGGTLRRSIRSEITRDKEGRVTMLIGADTKYARYVERGTSRMAAQPYLKPSLYQARVSA